MKTELDKIIEKIGQDYKDDIMACARNYVEVDIGKAAEQMGRPELKAKYHQIYAVVPLRTPKPGMKVRIDGRTFVNYALFESGVALPGYIVRDASLPHQTYIPNDSMICNFT